MRFADIPGQQDLIQGLVNAIEGGHVAHAQLFAGPEGGVALMLALAYAQYLNCDQPAEGDSCGRCPACIKTSKFIHPDFHFCFPTAKSKILGDDSDEINSFLPLFRSFLTEMPFGTIHDWAEKAEFENRTPIINIKAVRTTMQGLQLKAYEGKYKIQIIWLPETMRSEGANSFLKLLEEPPPFTVFLLVSTQAEQLLPTIISRTQRVTVPRIDDGQLAGYLEDKFQVHPEKASAIAALSEGSIAEALKLLSEKDDDFHGLFMDWQRACFTGNIEKLLLHTESFSALGKEMQKSYLRYSLNKLRNALAISQGAEESVHLNEKEKSDLGNLGKVFTLPLIELIMNQLEKAFYHINQNASSKMVFLDTSLQLAKGYNSLRKK
jgi:DNA polymerase-3 subunit delta'